MAAPSDLFTVPLDEWVSYGIKDVLVPALRPVFNVIKMPIDWVLNNLEALLQWLPFIVILIAMTILAWRTAGRGVMIFTFIGLIVLDLIEVWDETMTTLSMIVTAVVFCAVVGVPLGILASRSDRFASGIRPVLDIMQTIPPFVYLVPIVMLFGVGMVPGVIATIVFALPPIIRLTNLGIRQVQASLVEAAYAFGASPKQVLWDVQVPLALRTIMAGLNQTLMLALSMAVIAALIGAGGLGLIVYTGLGRLDVGAATEGGLGIVLIAIMLDRITQGLGENNPGERRSLIGTMKSLFSMASQKSDDNVEAGASQKAG